MLKWTYSVQLIKLHVVVAPCNPYVPSNFNNIWPSFIRGKKEITGVTHNALNHLPSLNAPGTNPPPVGQQSVPACLTQEKYPLWLAEIFICTSLVHHRRCVACQVKIWQLCSSYFLESRLILINVMMLALARLKLVWKDRSGLKADSWLWFHCIFVLSVLLYAAETWTAIHWLYQTLWPLPAAKVGEVSRTRTSETNGTRVGTGNTPVTGWQATWSFHTTNTEFR